MNTKLQIPSSKFQVPIRNHRPAVAVWFVIGVWILELGIFCASAQTPAFPGALGFGANVTGGRGGSVYHVTTLADSGTGSFRDAVSHSGRIIVFDVGGYIKLNTAVSCSGNLTIAGQTAPGGGIGFRGGEISFSSRSNIICRHIRIRPGSETASSTDDALAFANGRTMIFDHVSLEFGPWNNVGCVSSAWQTTPVTEVTFQNCLNADPTGQQFGAHTESVNSTMSWFYSIFANSHNRNPLSKINDVFVNNVLYNCSAGYTTHTGTSFDHDIVNNYFVSGPADGGSSDFPWFQVDNNQSIYESGNLKDGNQNSTLDGAANSVYWYQGIGTSLGAPWSALTTSVPNYSAPTAFRLAVSQAGAFPRDQVDDLVISQVKTLGNGPTGTGAGTVGPGGGLYTSQTQTGLGNNGYGTINGGVAPIDTDNDGMPDYWEKAVGLNFNSASDTMTIGADGYANVERYINWLADPHALTITNTPVDIDLWQYTGGFTNVSPTYTTTILSNGVVTLNSGHVAHFSPTANFSGLGSFQFTVTGSDGTAWTNNVTIVMTTVTTPNNLIWQGDGSTNVWGNGSGANWFNGTNLVAFNSGDSVTFDDTGSNAPAITLTGNLPATSIYVLAQQDYTFAGNGAINGGAVLFKTGSGQLTILTTNSFSGGTTINDGIVQLGDGVAVNGSLTGNLTNNDTLIYANPGAVSSAVSLAGYGALIKNAAGAVTLSGTHTFTGSVTINAGSLGFTGTLPPTDLSNNTALVLAPTSFQNFTNVISGPGAVTTSPSGGFIVSGTNTFAGNLTNTSGFLILSNNAAAGAGTVVYVGGYVVPAAGMVITNDFSIPSSTSDLNLMATNSGTATWAGNIVNLGSGASWRPGSDGGTLVFTGTAQLGARNFIVPRGTFQIAANAVISATGAAVAFGRDGTGGNRSANVTIKDNAVVTLGVCNLGGGLAGGNSTLTLQNSAVLNCGANNFDLNNVNRTTAQTFIRLNGGTMTVGGFTKTKTSQTNSLAFNGGILKAGKDNAAFLPAFNVATNLVQAGGAIIDDGGFAVTMAGPLLHDPALGSTPDGGLMKSGTGTVTLLGVNTYTGNTIVSAGTLTLPNTTTIGGSLNMLLGAGSVLDLSTGVGGLTFGAGRKLSGTGSVKGTLTMGSGATLSPGASMGTLTFSNSLILAAGSTNFFEVSHAALTNDLAKIFGALTSGGTLIVTNLAGTLAAGDSFKLFDAGSYSGSFSTVILPPLNQGLAWTNQLSSSGAIAVISTAPATPPVFGAVNFSGNALTFSGSNGPANGSYFVLTSTNLAVPRAAWGVLATNPFDASGNFTFTNSVDATQPQKFYLLQLP